MKWRIGWSFLFVCLSSASAQVRDVWEAVTKIKADEPMRIRFDLGEGLPQGGHLQGVQWFDSWRRGILASVRKFGRFLLPFDCRCARE